MNREQKTTIEIKRKWTEYSPLKEYKPTKMQRKKTWWKIRIICSIASFFCAVVAEVLGVKYLVLNTIISRMITVCWEHIYLNLTEWWWWSEIKTHKKKKHNKEGKTTAKRTKNCNAHIKKDNLNSFFLFCCYFFVWARSSTHTDRIPENRETHTENKTRKNIT